MTGKERLLCALNHQEPDTVPIFECLYSRPLFKEVLGYVPEVFDPVSVFKCCEKIGYDFAFIPIPGVSGFRPAGMTSEVYTDEWGITYKMTPQTWPIDAGIKTPLHNGEDWKNYTMPDANAEFRYTGLGEVLKMSKENGMGVVGNVRGPYSCAWQLFGLEDFSILLYTEPETIEAVLTATTDFAITAARRMYAMGVDAVIFSDDYGSNLQPLMSPDHFKQFLVPQLERIRAATKEMGCKMLLHSDGHIHPLLPDIMATGIEGLHPIERSSGMDLAEIKAKYGKQVCIFGNVDNKSGLIDGTPETIAEMVKECIRVAAPGGGYCLSSDHSVHDDIPNENVFALYEAGRRYGRYPIEL
jgi:uroporphyrinogen decarboxylase